jgi:ubiquinone/menaquinone biosynthesis C-methylase UbiE
VSAEDIRHPLFARFFDHLSGVMEVELGARRDELLSGLTGRVIEVGAGNGINFRHYPQSVTEVVALEPEPYLRAKAEQAARAAAVHVDVQAGVAAALPFEDASFDAVIASLVLCSVLDQAAALREFARVLKPGGELRFMEHVRGAARSGKARIQRALDRSGLWPLIAGGCHCGRDTVAAIGAAGFTVATVEEFKMGPSWTNTNPHVIGTARR